MLDKPSKWPQRPGLCTHRGVLSSGHTSARIFFPLMTQWCSVNQSKGLCGAGDAPGATSSNTSSVGATLASVVVSGASRTRQERGETWGGCEAELAGDTIHGRRRVWGQVWGLVTRSEPRWETPEP